MSESIYRARLHQVRRENLEQPRPSWRGRGMTMWVGTPEDAAIRGALTTSARVSYCGPHVDALY